MSGKNEILNTATLFFSATGNSRMILGCSAYLHTQDNYTTSYLSPIPFLYIQPITRLSLKVSYLYNRGNNIIEDNGYIVNNSPDLTQSRWSFLLNADVSKHLSIYALYQLEFKEEIVQRFNYKYNVILAGIKIIP
jgi:hypothetical protein